MIDELGHFQPDIPWENDDKWEDEHQWEDESEGDSEVDSRYPERIIREESRSDSIRENLQNHILDSLDLMPQKSSTVLIFFTEIWKRST